MKELKIIIEPRIIKPAPLAVHVFTWQRFSVPLLRCFVQISLSFSVIACFSFASKSGVNAGIISAIFSSSCIFTIVIFYIKYGVKISLIDAIGTGLILLCVAMIALGGTGGSDNIDTKSID
jgi:drug/metabolite transporter (DMT)-like permease